MESPSPKLFVCDCGGSMPLEAGPLGAALGQDIRVRTRLCREQIGDLDGALADGGPIRICCTQEAPLFTETATQAGSEAVLSFVNIRERAGWSAEGEGATAKIAALLAEAAVAAPDVPSIGLKSEGRVLIYGRDQAALDAAAQVDGRLTPTVVLSGGDDVMPTRMTRFPVFAGTVKELAGHLGAFEVAFDGFAAADPTARDTLRFDRPRDGVALDFDLVVDLTGGTPLVGAPDKRDGYFHPDPGNPALVQRALFDATDLVGEFDKPRYVAFDGALCAHSRSHKTGCTRCIDVCPASAIQPNGDVVAIDPAICAGCGSCASVCPTGASTYAMPLPDVMFRRLRALLRGYRDAGGESAVLLVHDGAHGEEMIAAMARFDRGLPARVLPFAVNEATQIGVDFLATAIAYGATDVIVLADPKKRDERTGLDGQVALAEAALAGLGHGSGRIFVVDDSDPGAVCDALYGLGERPAIAAADYLPMGKKRTLATMALDHLHATAPAPTDMLALPPGAPFGGVSLNADGCTLCLACVGACPTGALLDNPEAPMLRFIEQACIQCGLCRTTCPESVITLVPRFNFTPEANREMVLKEESPFECISCGKPFGVRASIERTIEKLVNHPMFAKDPAGLDRLRMCDDCRVNAQFGQAQPMARGTRPVTRTTDDYIGGKYKDEDD